MEAACYSIYKPGFYNYYDSTNRLCHNILEELGYKVTEPLISDKPENQGLGSVFVRKGTVIEITGEGKDITIGDEAQRIDFNQYIDLDSFAEALLKLVAKNVFFTIQDEHETSNHYVVRDLVDSEIIDTICSRLGGDEFHNVYYFTHNGKKVVIRE